MLNAFLMPLVVGFLVALAIKALPEPLLGAGLYLGFLVGVSAVVIAVGSIRWRLGADVADYAK